MIKALMTFILFGILLLAWLPLQSASEVSGIVVSSVDGQPISDARVRMQGASDFALTGNNGAFLLTLNSISAGSPVSVTAGKRGWYNKLKIIIAGSSDTIRIDPLPSEDNPDYTFKDPEYCNSCHSTLYEQWQQSKHAKAVTNPMLKQIYNGTDTKGNAGVYPGFKLDFPNQGGDCGDCHAPTAALHTPGNTEMNDIWQNPNADTNGVHCDFCHKISDVTVNYATGVNGSISVLRPSDHGRDINYGQFDDVTTFWMGGTYNDVFQKSAYCSGCHQYANQQGLVVDDTYDTWASSVYATAGVQCQDCHMKPNSLTKFAGGIAGGDAVIRDSTRIYNQRFRGGTDTSMLKRAAKIRVDTLTDDNVFWVESYITNVGAGHKLPTGVSFRNMIYSVIVTYEGDTLKPLAGDTIDFYGGVGQLRDGNFSGQSGKSYTMLNRDTRTGEIPSPNWNSNERVYDNRIAPKTTDTVRTAFAVETGAYTISTKLIYRAAYKSWADAKGWDMREFIMKDTTFTVSLIKTYHPEKIVLHQNFPNPFNAGTSFKYDVPSQSMVTLEVYNLLGQKIKTLIHTFLPQGQFTAHWDGRNDQGHMVATGVYIGRLTASGKTTSKKILMVK